MLKIENLDIIYDRIILKDVNATFKRGAVTAITGASGKGKSSILNVLGLIMNPNPQFTYSLDGEIIDFKNESTKAIYRTLKIGFIFQQNNLIQGLSVLENVMLPQRMLTDDEDSIKKKALELLKFTDLQILADKYPGDLSGGEEQRTAVARALINDADVILADEPAASLDQENRDRILGLFKKLAHDLNKIVIIVTHDRDVAAIADTVYVIKDKMLVRTKDDEVRNVVPYGENEREIKRRQPLKFIKNYEKKRRKEKKLSKLLIVTTALVAAVVTIFFNFGDAFSARQEQFIDAITDRGLFVINDTLCLDSEINYDAALSITQTEQESIESLRGIGNIYPYYEFTSYGTTAKGSEYIHASIVLEDEGKELKILEYGSRDEGSFSVVPLYPEENKSGLGLLLSENLARQLSADPKELIGKTLVISCLIPVKLFESEATMDNSQKKIRTDHDIRTSMTIRRKIDGIIDEMNVVQRTEETGNYIYLDYDEFMDI